MLSGVFSKPGELCQRWMSETLVPSARVSATETHEKTSVWTSECDRYIIWIDGVGAWQICIGSRFLIGGPTLEHDSADICLMANISRRHATLQRIDENWFIQAHGPVVVSGRTAGDQALLKTGDEIRLAERVRLGFRVPNVLSGSAVMDFESPHRPQQSVNGIILMTDNCLLGPRRDHHVCCPEWPDLIVLFRQDGQLRCRSRMALKVNDDRVRDSAILTDGAVVSGDDLRFRLERLKNLNGTSS